MNVHDEKVMLMQSHKEFGVCRQAGSSDPKVTPRGSNKCFIRACAELRCLSQRIVSAGHAWLSQGESRALHTSFCICYYPIWHVLLDTRRTLWGESWISHINDFTVSLINDASGEVKHFFFALVQVWSCASVPYSFTYYRAQATAKDFISPL